MPKLRCLVLNQSYMPLSLFPLSVTTAEDAIHNYFGGSCDIVVAYDVPVLTPSRQDLYWPSVIANHNNHSFKKELRLRKELLYYRDHCVCMYCGVDLTIQSMTYDHVQPRTKGGPHSWENVVAACKDCNNQKSDEVNPKKWKPRKIPWAPNYFQMIDIRKKYPIYVDHESWIDFLPKWDAPIIVGRPGQSLTHVEHDS